MMIAAVHFKRFLALAAFLLAVISCEVKDGPEVPASITLSSGSLAAAQAGETLPLTITAPARPKVTGIPDWIVLTDGTYKDCKVTVGLTVAANDTYAVREAVLRVTASGAADATVTVKQDGKAIVPDPAPGTNEAWKLSAKLGLGWNMGNHFDAYYNGSWAGEKEGYPAEEAWGGVKSTQATFDGVRRAGFTSVRIPVSWLRMIGGAPDHSIDKAWMDRVHEVVQYAHKAGLSVIVNTHHDENHGVDNGYQWLDIKNAARDPEVNESIKAEIRAVWTQIAERFRDCGDWLILEGFNELNDGGWGWSADFRADPTRQCNILNEWNQVFVDAVRATGGNNATRWLGVPTYAANPQFTQYLVLPDDPAGKLMVSVHFYDPFDYTLGDMQYPEWGHTGASWNKAQGGDEDHVKEVFSMLRTNYVDKNVPVYIGEFGCSMRAPDTRSWYFYLYYLEYVVKAAKVYGMPCFLWDNGVEGEGKEHHGYIHHGTGDYVGRSRTAVDRMVKARFTEDAAYTLQSVYDSAPEF